jgi:cell division protein FtsI/penicillin-binding protein 2
MGEMTARDETGEPRFHRLARHENACSIHFAFFAEWVEHVERVFYFFLVLLFAVSSASAQTQHFSQTAEAVFNRSFPSTNLSYLLMDASGKILAERWSSSEAVAPGSLVKPFLALAYGEQYGGRFPVVRCLGTQSRCWLPRGHGSLSLEEAIAQSCNAYFLQLAAGLDRTKAAQTFARYGLAGLPTTAATESLMGLGRAWEESPLALAKAYLQLEKERQLPVQSRIIRGMNGSAAHGTARAVDALLGRNVALAKTGTALCTHTPKAAVDGFTVILYPAAQPRLLLLVRVHGVTGAESAKTAAAMLHSLGDGE